MPCARDQRVFLMGEDVGHYGGCFAVSRGLLEEFGPERMRDTPLSESAFVGAGIGAALGWHAADRRDHDLQFQPARARPDHEHRRHVAAHVGRPIQRAARHPHGHRRRQTTRRAAFAQPGRLVCPHPRHQGAHSRHARGRARHALDRARRPGPGADFRKPNALQPGRHAGRRRRTGGNPQGPHPCAPAAT